ncbi:TrkH family potassium uptake protein [Amphibiibacter pelophylacis]|uniref:Potassium transporter TrkG n=1 Tax=Amphibiibacter pelophylacis TaxID=1799477 RepID=A0ACC6P3N6_9BURK
MRLWDPHSRIYYDVPDQRRGTLQLSPPLVLALGTVLLAFLGTLALKMPWAAHQPLEWVQAAFMATSAVTITGLAVIDPGSQLTVAGQMTLILLVQLGGLGFVTFAVLAAMSLGARIGIGQQMLAQEAYNQTHLAQAATTARAVLLYSLFFEAVGFVLLTLLWRDELGVRQAMYHGLFFSVSAFNNAGFSLHATSLMPFGGDAAVQTVISLLFLAGGLGFVVLLDIRHQRRWSRLSTNTRVVLTATAVLSLGAFVLIWLLEARNPKTLAPLAWPQQAVLAWFQAVTPRSAGFNSLDIASMTDASTVLMTALMFIGGGSMGTSGGIKLGTFVILVVATYAYLRRRDEVTLFGRSVPQRLVMKALSLALITLFLIFCGVFVLAALEPGLPLVDVMFEVVSALCTVGLSRGLTGQLSTVGQSVLIVLMIIGRLGPLTLGYILATPQTRRVRHPECEIQVG